MQTSTPVLLATYLKKQQRIDKESTHSISNGNETIGEEMWSALIAISVCVCAQKVEMDDANGGFLMKFFFVES